MSHQNFLNLYMLDFSLYLVLHISSKYNLLVFQKMFSISCFRTQGRYVVFFTWSSHLDIVFYLRANDLQHAMVYRCNSPAYNLQYFLLTKIKLSVWIWTSTVHYRYLTYPLLLLLCLRKVCIYNCHATHVHVLKGITIKIID